MHFGRTRELQQGHKQQGYMMKQLQVLASHYDPGFNSIVMHQTLNETDQRSKPSIYG
jgi:hypothetical protein